MLRIRLDMVSGVLTMLLVILGLGFSMLRIRLDVVSGVLTVLLVILGLGFSMLRIRLDAVSGILFAINRTDMRWVSIKIWSSDPKLFFVRVDPCPQLPTGNQSRCPGLALYAHDVGCQPVTVAAAEASTMI
jgi:hypothetical protein